MNNLSVHSELGCILFLNADIEYPTEAGKITRVSEGFFETIWCKIQIRNYWIKHETICPS